MKTTAALLVTLALAATASAQDLTPASADVNMQPDYAAALARTAYVWAYPMVNTFNRRAKITQAPRPGLLGGVLPVAPRGRLAMLHDYIDPSERAVACPNQDVVYGQGWFSLDEEPVVLQVPDFGDRFWVYAIYDARTSQVGQLGKPYGSKPGFYLLTGPKWKGELPPGFTGIITSPTSLAVVLPRVFMNDTAEDRAAIQPVINQIRAYPLVEFDGKMRATNWSQAPNIPNPAGPGGGETKWVVPEKFFDQLGEVLDIVPPQPGEEALYSQLRALLKIADRDPAIKKLITDTAIETDRTLIRDFLKWEYNGQPAGNGWNRSQHNAEWGLDYYNRATTARSNIFENRPSETQYFYTDKTSDGAALDGTKTYAITFAKGQLPPVKGFWSLTLYNEDHFFHPNPLKRYSLGTKNKTLQYGDDGSLTLYAGAKSPGPDKESNWLPAPEGPFSLYIRAYWGEEAIRDGSWRPPVVKALE